MNRETILTNIVLGYIPIIAIGLFLPKFSKRGMLFGVDISESRLDCSEIKLLRRSYCMVYGFVSAILSFVANGAALYMDSSTVSSVGTVGPLVALIGSYIYIHARTKALVGMRETEMDRFQKFACRSERTLKYRPLYPMGFIVIFTTVFTAIRYSRIPSTVPVQYDFYGKVLEYGEKGILTAFSIPLIQGVSAAAILLIYRNIMNKNQGNDRWRTPSGRNEKHRGNLLIWIAAFGTGMSGYCLYLQIRLILALSVPGTAHLTIGALVLMASMFHASLATVRTGRDIG